MLALLCYREGCCTIFIIVNGIFQKTLKQCFRLWAECVRYSEVIMFCSGLMKDPTPLVEHCYEMYIEKEVKEVRTGKSDEEEERELTAQGKSPYDRSLFDSLYNESTVKLPGSAQHNRYINCCNQDRTKVYTPSQYYEFVAMKEDVEWNRGSETVIPECVININMGDESVTNSLLTTCFKISEKQPVTDLLMEEVRCEDLTVKAPIMSSKAVSLNLIRCILPVSYLRGIIHQLFECSHTLQSLELSDMDSKPIEKDLDQLLERLVSFHESGKAGSNLMLVIGGYADERSYVSQEFVDKWRPRCERIKSIDCQLIGDTQVNY